MIAQRAWKSVAGRIERIARSAMDHEGGSIFIHAHQDSTAISARVFDRRAKRFQHWRRVVYCCNGKRRRDDLERPLWKGNHSQLVATFRQLSINSHSVECVPV
jgi:hypothetical protein